MMIQPIVPSPKQNRRGKGDRKLNEKRCNNQGLGASTQGSRERHRVRFAQPLDLLGDKRTHLEVDAAGVAHERLAQGDTPLLTSDHAALQHQPVLIHLGTHDNDARQQAISVASGGQPGKRLMRVHFNPSFYTVKHQNAPRNNLEGDSVVQYTVCIFLL